MTSSKAPSNKVYHLQFPCHDSRLLSKLAVDIKRSQYSSRPKYLIALLEKLLSLKTGSNLPSCLAQLFELIELFESLPTKRIRWLASTQNRSFAQMVKHLIEIALCHYPEEAQQPALVQEVAMPQTGVYRRQADRRRSLSAVTSSETRSDLKLVPKNM